MFISAGLGNIDEYPDYVKAGADALFCGYIPAVWTDRYGPYTPLNRREVLCSNVQIGSQSELHILREMVRQYRIPVRIALNAPHFSPDQYDTICGIMVECMQAGFHAFIIADPGLLFYLKHRSFSEAPEIIISGEAGEINRHYMEWCRSMHASGMIFHRKLTTAEIASCIAQDRLLHPDVPTTYEAFILNELCHYTGAFCNSVHCDAFAPLCRVPYIAGTRQPGTAPIQAEQAEIDYDLPGASGCGLCALWRLRAAGITHLKLVSRGNYTDATIRDIQLLRRALAILEACHSESEYLAVMLQALFPGGCSRSCYYPEMLQDQLSVTEHP